MQFRLSLVAAALLLPAAALAQEWTFQGYDEHGTPWAKGTLQLRETSAGVHRGRLFLPGSLGADACWRGERGARVEHRQDLQIVHLEPLMKGCAEVRYLLKTDGSGGTLEVKQADGSWSHDGLDRNLKRK